MAEVVFNEVSRRYPGSDRAAVDELSLEVADGEFLVLVGPSGCGKSTSLRMLAGLEDVDSGSIWIGGRDVTGRPPKDRDIAMVFQNYALYPHMTVGQNMAWSLRIAGLSKPEIAERVRAAASLLDLDGFLDRKPRTLSGGQRQRVAMGRAIVREPQVFLMDEPLSNLDAQLRTQTRTEIAALQRRLGVTTVYVTHDQVEAMTMADRVAVLADGKLQQIGTPAELYERPANVFVAGFIGSPAMNILEVPIENGELRLGGAAVALPEEARDDARALDSIVIGLRPEDIHLAALGAGPTASVSFVEELGADAFIYGEIIVNPAQRERVVVRVSGRAGLPRTGDSISIELMLGRAHFFSPTNGKRLN